MSWRSICAVLVAALTSVGSTAHAASDHAKGPKPKRGEVVIIGHRGASGYRPEHTLAAYELAIRQCADFIEPDLVATRDGVLVARHENEISATTDVATRPEFAARETTKTVDGATVSGWFTEDFTVAELKTLRAKERIPSIRPQNAAFDGRFQIPTLQEIIDLARRSRTCNGRLVGLYPETKHPTYFRAIGLGLEERLVTTLHRNGYRGAHAPVFVQSFEVDSLQRLDRLTRVPLVQLLCAIPTAAQLDAVRAYADGIGVCKEVITPTSNLIANAHARRLLLHVWTLRRENAFLPPAFRIGSDLLAPGNMTGEARSYIDAGVDGLFTDNPDLAIAAVRR